MGLFAHRVMEAVGRGCQLTELLDGGGCRLAMGLQSSELDGSQVQEVLRQLEPSQRSSPDKRDGGVPGVQERSQIIRHFGKYILSERPDKVIKTAEGWKNLDFKFSSSERHNEAYKFQTKFYLYIAREIFSPLLGAELFYLKDGISKKIEFANEEYTDFERELASRIQAYHSTMAFSSASLASR